MTPVREAITAFLSRYPGLADPGGATSQCQIATRGLAEELRATGMAAEEVWVRGHRVHPDHATPRAMAATRHMLVRLSGGAFVDITRRQYEPAATHPRYYSSEADLSSDWCEIDDGPAGGTVEEESWRELGLPPWTPGHYGKGLLVAGGPFHCWTVDAEYAPHHHGALRILGLGADEIDSYAFITEDGGFTLGESSNWETAAARITALDPRLRLEDDGDWRF